MLFDVLGKKKANFDKYSDTVQRGLSFNKPIRKKERKKQKAVENSNKKSKERK